MMVGQGEAMREQPPVARINDLLEEVEKGISEFGSEIYVINKRLLPVIPPPKDEESKDLAKNLKVEMKIPQQEGWFIQTIVKLESLRNHLRQINQGEVKRLKRTVGLLEPDSIESKGDERGC